MFKQLKEIKQMDVSPEELNMYDEYEGVDNGLYIRTTVPVTLDSGETEKAWIYVAGPQLWQNSNSFTEVPEGDWHSMKTLKMLDRVYEKQFQEA